MKLDSQFCEQDNKSNVYIENNRGEELLLLLKSKRAGLNKMNIAGAIQKDQRNQTKLGKETSSRNNINQDFQKNSVAKLYSLNNDQSQMGKQCSSLPSSNGAIRTVSKSLPVVKSASEKGKSDNVLEAQTRVGSLSSSPKWSRIKDKFERGDSSTCLEHKEPSSKVICSNSNISIKKNTLQKKPPESKIMPLQSRSVNVPSSKLKCSSLPYKLVSGNDRLHERSKRPVAFRTHTKYNSLDNNSPKPSSLSNSSVQPTQSVLSRLNKPTVNLSEEVTKQQKVKIPVRSAECKKNESPNYQARKGILQDAKASTKAGNCHPVPTSRTSLSKPKSLLIYSNVSLHSANISKPLQYTCKNKLSKEGCTSNENEMLAKCETVEKTANSKLKLQKSTATLPEQKLRTVSDSEQATHLRILDREVTESKVAYLTNKFNFLSCQNLEMKKSCSAVNVDEANKYILSKSFSASNVFSTALRKNESYCHKSSQKQTSLTSSDEILSECLPANDTSCACTVMGKCSCLGLFSNQTDQSGKKPEGNHICKAGGEICTQPVSNKNIPNQDLITTESERLNLVQKAVLSYEENLGILSPEKQKKGCLSKLKDSPVTINDSGFNEAVIERIENHSSTANIKYASTTEKTVNEKLKRTVSNKEDTRFYSNDRVIKSVKEVSSEAKQENSKALSNSHMLSKSSRSLTLDSIRYTSSFLHNLTSSKECITTNMKVKELQLGERQYVNQSEMKIPPSLKPNSSFLWTSSSSEYKKLGIVGSNHYYENHMIAGENIHGQSGEQTKLRKQSNCSVDFGNNGSCDSDDQGSWIDVSDAEVDNEKRSSSSVLISTLRRNKGRKDAQKRNSLRRSWAESLRATACASDCNDDEYQDVSAWETVDGENSSGSTEMENHYEPLYESIYQNVNFDDRSNSSQSPDDSNKHNSDTSSEIFDNDDDVASLNSEKTITSMDEKKKSIKRQWSLNRSDIKTELTSKLNKMMSKKSSYSSSEIVPKTREKNTETKRNTLMRYFRGQKSNTTGQLLGSSTAKKELSTFYINEKDIKSEDLLPCNKLSDSSVHNTNSMSVDEKIYPIHTVDHFRKSQSEKMIKPVLRRHVQRPTAPPPLPPGDPITKCRGGTKSMEFIHSQAITFNKTRSLDSTYYNALSDGNVLYSEITIQECNLPNKNSVGEISSISTSEEMITSSSSSSERTISDNSTLSTCSKGSRYSGNCYSVASSATDSSSIDRDRNSGLSCNRESRTNSSFCYMEDNSMIGSSTLDSDSIIYGNKTEILKSPFEEEPLYQFYLKDVRTRATLWQRMISDDEQSETESVYVNVNEKSTDGPLVLKSRLSAMELIKGDEMGQRTLWCHVPEVKKSGILATLSLQDRNLQEAMFEVITSEASYLKSLNILVEHFIQCPEFADEFSLHCVLSRRDRHVLFSDVLPVKEVSERLLADLEDHWKENIMLSRVCEILHNHAAKHFSVYVRYCSNQIYQDRTLKELKETKPEFTEVLNRLESSTACQCLDMLSFLMLPMQRITRLPLLVDAIFHRLSMESPLYESCKATLALLNKIVQDCNEGARRMERMEEMLSIERLLDFKDCKSIPLISTSRWLVKKGELTSFICDTSSKRTISFSSRWSKVPVYLFLFTDYLMITKKKSEENFAVLDYCPRNMVQVAVLENDDDHLPCKLPSSGKNFFQLTMLKNHKNKAIELVLGVSLESERTRWMDAVTPPISDNPDERIYEVWDCPQVQCIYPYTAQQPDELMLDESDVVNVFRKMSDGWYEGERIRDGVRGWFPASYTEEIVSSHVRARNLRQRYRLLILSSENKNMPRKMKVK